MPWLRNILINNPDSPLRAIVRLGGYEQESICPLTETQCLALHFHCLDQQLRIARLITFPMAVD